MMRQRARRTEDAVCERVEGPSLAHLDLVVTSAAFPSPAPLSGLLPSLRFFAFVRILEELRGREERLQVVEDLRAGESSSGLLVPSGPLGAFEKGSQWAYGHGRDACRFVDGKERRERLRASLGHNGSLSPGRDVLVRRWSGSSLELFLSL